MKIQTIALAVFIIFANNHLVKADNYENLSLVSKVIQDHTEFFSKSSLESFKASPLNFVKNLGFSDIEYSVVVGNYAVAMKARRIRPPYLLLVPICILGGYVIYKKYFKKNQEEEQKNQI